MLKSPKAFRKICKATLLLSGTFAIRKVRTFCDSAMMVHGSQHLSSLLPSSCSHTLQLAELPMSFFLLIPECSNPSLQLPLPVLLLKTCTKRQRPRPKAKGSLSQMLGRKPKLHGLILSRPSWMFLQKTALVSLTSSWTSMMKKDSLIPMLKFSHKVLLPLPKRCR